MKVRMNRLVGLTALVSLAVGGCGGGDSAQEPADATETAVADLIGYYAYSDPERGGHHLALLDTNRFLLVREPSGGSVAPGVADAGDTEGVVGWYILQGDSIYLNSDDMYARGMAGPEVIRLEFVDPIGPAEVAEEIYTMPFQRDRKGATEGKQGEGGNEAEGGGGE